MVWAFFAAVCVTHSFAHNVILATISNALGYSPLITRFFCPTPCGYFSFGGYWYCVNIGWFTIYHIFDVVFDRTVVTFVQDERNIPYYPLPPREESCPQGKLAPSQVFMARTCRVGTANLTQVVKILQGMFFRPLTPSPPPRRGWLMDNPRTHPRTLIKFVF